VFDFSKLLDSKFLFDTSPADEFASKNLFLFTFGLIVILAVIVWLLAHYLVKNSKLTKKFLETKVFYLLLTMGLVGLILTVFRIVGAAYLSMRFLFLIFLFAIFAWAIYLIFYLVVSFPKEYREEIDQKRRERYLPKRK